ncbi:MAG: hypothetical protein HON55_02995 [Legionellales bacterium]|mgnify:CR=1 FL=1|jgi:hypothetical protein|nr:hypothetical protein [Legionellales bacterium]
MTYQVGEKYNLRKTNSTYLSFIIVCIIVLAAIHYRVTKIDNVIKTNSLMLENIAKTEVNILNEIDLAKKLNNEIKELVTSSIKNNKCACDNSKNKAEGTSKPAAAQNQVKATESAATKITAKPAN